MSADYISEMFEVGRDLEKREAETVEEGTKLSDMFYRMEDTEQVLLAQLTNRTHGLYL